MLIKEWSCMSVPAGWQTAAVDSRTGQVVRFVGPAFRKIDDLWTWQRLNLHKICTTDSVLKSEG